VGIVVTDAADSVVALRNISVGYDGRLVISHLSGDFVRGSLTAIVGPNGAGKSTLLKGIVGLLRPSEGIIDRARLRGGTIAYLPQLPDIDRSFPISVIDTVLLGHWRQIGWAGAATRRSSELARRALAAVGLEGFERWQIEALSAGQFQRVLFARLILQDAELILLDEPFHAVDWRTSEELLSLVAGWQQEGRTVAAVLHDLDQVRAYFPQTLLIARECVAWGLTQEVLVPQNLQRARNLSGTWSAAVQGFGVIPVPDLIEPSR